MDSVFISIISFVVALSILIAIHEFGHYWIARKVGIKILRFSIGFGKPIFRRHFNNDRSEFVLAAIPLGGYVKMLDEREGEVAEAELHRAFNRKSLGERSAVVAAGPAFNFILAIALYWILFLIGVPGLKPIMDEVQQNSVFAVAGLEKGDEIIQVDGNDTPTLEAVRMALIEGILDQKEIAVKVSKSDGSEKELQVNLQEVPVDTISNNLLQYLGLNPFRSKLPPIVGQVMPNGAAEKSGFKSDDRIISVDGVIMDDWVAWANYVRERPNQSISVTVIRDEIEKIILVTPELVETQTQPIGRVGLMPFVPEDFYDELMATQHYGIFDGFAASVGKTWDMSILTLQMLWKMITGQASLQNISGPISIAQYAGQSAQIGILSFLSFMAIISVSLGVINLLPIPLLDGGHLMYYLIELVKGSPVSDEGMLLGQKIGIVVLGGLMFIAVFNDISRIFH